MKPSSEYQHNLAPQLLSMTKEAVQELNCRLQEGQMDLESKQEHVAVEDWDALEFSLKTTKASLLTSHQHEMKQTPPQITNKEVYKGKLEMQGIYKLLTKADI